MLRMDLSFVYSISISNWYLNLEFKGAFTYDVKCFLGIVDLPTYILFSVYLLSFLRAVLVFNL